MCEAKKIIQQRASLANADLIQTRPVFRRIFINGLTNGGNFCLGIVATRCCDKRMTVSANRLELLRLALFILNAISAPHERLLIYSRIIK